MALAVIAHGQNELLRLVGNLPIPPSQIPYRRPLHLWIGRVEPRRPADVLEGGRGFGHIFGIPTPFGNQYGGAGEAVFVACLEEELETAD